MFVEEIWRGQRVVGWCTAPPVRPALVLPGALCPPSFPPPTVGTESVRGEAFPPVAPASVAEPAVVRPGQGTHTPSYLPGDGGLVELAAWRAAVAAAPAGEVAAVLRARPDRPADCGPQDWAQVVVDTITARQRLVAYEAAQQTLDLIDLAATCSEVPDDSREFLGCELGLAMGVADSTASDYVAEAIDLATRCPATFQALEDGDISPMKASAIRRGTAMLTDEITALVETDVLPGAHRCTMPKLREKIAKSIIRRDPDGADTRHQKARSRRKVGVRAEDDGMALLWMYGTAHDVGTVMECLTAIADADADKMDADRLDTDQLDGATTDGAGDRDTRTIGERRVDALVDICADVLARGVFADRPLPEQQRRRPQLLVTIPATALLGDGKGEVADLAGYGPITPGQARVIAADATWRRLVCDPTSGALLDYGRKTYSPPAALRDFILTRDRTCIMPGCRQPAHRCDIDHRQPFHPGQDTGGDTSDRNCSVLCRRHHRAKDHGGYRLHRTPGGDHRWITPLGRSYLRERTRLWDPPDTHPRSALLDHVKKSRPDHDDVPPF